MAGRAARPAKLRIKERVIPDAWRQVAAHTHCCKRRATNAWSWWQFGNADLQRLSQWIVWVRARMPYAYPGVHSACGPRHTWRKT